MNGSLKRCLLSLAVALAWIGPVTCMAADDQVSAPQAQPDANKAKSNSNLVGEQKKAFDYAIDNLLEKTDQGNSGGAGGIPGGIPNVGIPNDNQGKSLTDAPGSELGELKDQGSLLGM
jgi:hypothetical protein